VVGALCTESYVCIMADAPTTALSRLAELAECAGRSPSVRARRTVPRRGTGCDCTGREVLGSCTGQPRRDVPDVGWGVRGEGDASESPG
jgi:hypothetical protein